MLLQLRLTKRSRSNTIRCAVKGFTTDKGTLKEHTSSYLGERLMAAITASRELVCSCPNSSSPNEAGNVASELRSEVDTLLDEVVSHPLLPKTFRRILLGVKNERS